MADRRLTSLRRKLQILRTGAPALALSAPPRQEERYIIAIADDSGTPLDSLCAKLSAADIACDVMRNTFGAN